MIEELRRLVDQYAAWLKDRTTLRQVDSEWVEITTPYLDRHNDHLQIYARRDGDEMVLTDDGYTLDDLERSGCALDSPRRQTLLRLALAGFGVQLHGRALEARATSSTFAPKKHNLLQAMLAVNDLFYLASPVVRSLFFEDVQAWLDLCEVRYTPRVKFTGKSGLDHLFDFVIPRSRAQPERVLRAINNPNRMAATNLAFAWFDTKGAREPESRAVAVLNDSERAVSAEVTDALRSYEVHPVLWSARDAARGMLVQ